MVFRHPPASGDDVPDIDVWSVELFLASLRRFSFLRCAGGYSNRALKLLWVALLASTAHAAAVNLNFQPVDAEFSTSLNRMVMVSAFPNQIHIYNPVTNADVAVTLPAAPNSVSVSPDGFFAAVGHFNLISYVNLSNGTVQRTYAVNVNVTDLILGPSAIFLLLAMFVGCQWSRVWLNWVAQFYEAASLPPSRLFTTHLTGPVFREAAWRRA